MLKKWRFVIIILVLAIVLLFLPTSFSSKARNFTWNILKPVGYVGQHTLGRAFPFIKNIFHFNQIIKQNSNLVTENLNLQSRVAGLSEMQNENEILKKELGFLKTQDLTSTKAAAVIGQSNDYLKSLTIDKGKNDNLEEGDAVISQGILIGTITSVRDDNSDVTLITDYNSRIPVILQSSRGSGLLRGGLGGLTIEEIPLNIQITSSENVVTSGLDGKIPSGILVGKINNVISQNAEIFQKATMSSPIDFSHLEVVFIITK